MTVPRWAHWYDDEEEEAHRINAGRADRDFLITDEPLVGSIEESVREDARWEGNAEVETEEDES